ncbi:MAG TPA: DUF1684 domain-containing protein [Blastocatellia bacterium]|nr:DUF1684 domain-containing protein [Blastocatellia bacterium]
MTVRSNLRVGLIIIFLALSVIVTAADDPSYSKALEKWRADRLEEINGEDGWTTLIGLFWLNEGQNKFGSDPSNEIVLPRSSAPKVAGSIRLDNGVVTLEAKPDAGITSDGNAVSTLLLQSDDDGKPTVLKLGSLKLFVIKRGEKLGLRVKDKRNPARSRFAGLDYFPVDLKWRLDARFEPYDPPKIIPIVNVLGMVDSMTSTGALVFEVNGKSYRLDPVLEKGSKQLFIIFGDKTTGKETYGAGRYLYADPAGDDGKVVLDFNKAYNPPCAFTEFATCPLPPRQNRLAIRVEAGEKKYAGSAH